MILGKIDFNFSQTIVKSHSVIFAPSLFGFAEIAFQGLKAKLPKLDPKSKLVSLASPTIEIFKASL
jgi:hypothetical protein